MALKVKAKEQLAISFLRPFGSFVPFGRKRQSRAASEHRSSGFFFSLIG
jgi:hypothetical protein